MYGKNVKKLLKIYLLDHVHKLRVHTQKLKASKHNSDNLDESEEDDFYYVVLHEDLVCFPHSIDDAEESS